MLWKWEFCGAYIGPCLNAGLVWVALIFCFKCRRVSLVTCHEKRLVSWTTDCSLYRQEQRHTFTSGRVSLWTVPQLRRLVSISHRESSSLLLEQSVWDLWWAKCYGMFFFVQVFSFRFCVVNCHFISTPYPFGYRLRMDIGPIGGHSFTQMYLHSTTKDRKK